MIGDGLCLPLHADIWDDIWGLVCDRPVDCIEVVKVKAHVDPGTSKDPYVAQCAYFNIVNEQAKRAVQTHAGNPLAKIQKIVDKRLTNELNVKRYHDFLCAINARFHSLQKPEVIT